MKGTEKKSSIKKKLQNHRRKGEGGKKRWPKKGETPTSKDITCLHGPQRRNGSEKPYKREALPKGGGNGRGGGKKVCLAVRGDLTPGENEGGGSRID